MIYSKFAEIYNELMDHSLYEEWKNYVLKRVQSGKLLEVACGTGDLAILLHKAGFEVTATDLSYEMLSIAAKKLEEQNEYLELAQINMLDLDGLDNYDIVTCFDDSICYLSDLNELEQAFTTTYNHLNDGGKYLFDAHSIFQMDKKFPGYMFNFKNEENAFMWSSYIGEFEHSCEHELTFFTWNEELQAYDVDEEIHYERTYEISTYIEILKKVGFKDVKVSADFGKTDVKNDSTRWFFECTK